jgi:hypothetical protein
MAGTGGRTSGTWNKGENPKMQKGTKQKRTLLKESLGLTNWGKLKSFIENEGAEKLVDELQHLKGKDYILAYSSLAEFIRPKQQRTTIAGDPNNPLYTSGIDLSGLSPEELRVFIKAYQIRREEQ